MKTTLRNAFIRLKSLNLNDHELIVNGNKMIQYLLKYYNAHPDHPQIKTITTSLNNIKNNPSPFETANQRVLYRKELLNTFKAIEIYSRSMIETNDRRCKEIEQKLFNIAFIPGDKYQTKILPIYLLHDDFINTTDPICSLKSSTGSGKTRCAPFIFAIKSYQSKMRQPFFIMTQPNRTIIQDKIDDFTKILGDSVTLINNDYQQFSKIYQEARNDIKSIKKPVIVLFTPHNFARMAANRFRIFKYARFALDEIHERSVETDVIVSLLAKKLQASIIPLNLLMMTATPDDRLLKLFPNVKSFNLQDTQLFKIEDIKIEAPNFKELDNIAKEEAIKIIQKIKTKKLKLGHILIFTSGNRRINRIIDLISKNIPNDIKLIKKNEKSMRNKEQFYKDLDEQVKNKNSIYVLLIKYAGFLTPEEREIGKNPIPKHPNIIKVIVATNAIESSITIDGLAAVIDCGIFNQPLLDKEKGIQKIEESPISIQSQTQRRGRVGRKSEGICVQLTIKNHPPVKLVSPSIEKEDISSNILSLRKIKIKMEDIDNLPEPGISKSSMDNYINELKLIGALDENAELTNKGRQMSNFASLLPFVSASILQASENYKDNDKNLAQIAGSLIFLIISSDDLFIDPLTEGFRNNFDQDSDVITLLNSLISIKMKKLNGMKFKYELEDFGFHSGNALKLIGNVEQTARNILNREIDSLWENIKTFFDKVDKMSFIKNILDQIGIYKEQWLTCRQAKYFTVSNVLNESIIVYHGDKSLIDEVNPDPEILITNKRPGAKGFSTPGTCFIFQINKSTNEKYYGTIIHRDISKPETCHPMSGIGAPISFKNQFTIPLIEAYLGERINLYRPFQKTKTYKETKHGGFICFPEQVDSEKCVINYAPETDNLSTGPKLMFEACQYVYKITQFVPNTILVKNNSLKALVAITGIGCKDFKTKIIFYTDKNPIPYQIDQVTINYMIKNLNELKKLNGNLSIAMTGEKFFYSDDYENVLAIPTTSNKATFVFGSDPFFFSHLVLLSKVEIPGAKRLTWVDPKISVTYSDVDALIHIANVTYRGVVSVSHWYNQIYLMKKESEIIVDGILPQFRNTTQQSNIFHPIECMFDKYAMNCIKNDKLIKTVDLNKFKFSENIQEKNLRKNIITIRRVTKIMGKDFDYVSFINSLPPNIINISNEIKKLLTRRKYIDDNWKDISETKETRINAINEQKRIKQSLGELNPRLQRLINSYHNETELTEKDIIDLLLINSPKEILSINGLFVNPDHMVTSASVDDTEQIVNILENYRKDCSVEVVPQCFIVIHHRKNSDLSSEEFIELINETCIKFGGVVQRKSKYINFKDHNFDYGIMKITLFGGDFAIPFVGEIRRAIGYGDNIPLFIPNKIIPYVIRFRPNVIDSILNWIDEHDLYIEQDGPIFVGNKNEIDRALELISNPKTTIKIPYKSHIIPGNISIPHLTSLVNKKNRNLSFDKKWAIDKQTDINCRFLIVPIEIKDDLIQELFKEVRNKTQTKINEDDEILFDYCYLCGNEADLGGTQIPLYKENGSAKCHSFCTECAFGILYNEIKNLFDLEKDQPRFDLLMGNNQKINPISPVKQTKSDLWPSIPLGQFLWALISERKLNALSKTWFSAIVYNALHESPLFDFCPDHPEIIFRRKKNKEVIRCPNKECGMFRCADCNLWHKSGECKSVLEIPLGFRICPNCRKPVEKTAECNHIHCKCGMHFCYYCGWGPKPEEKEVYSHMSDEHGGYFNDPPDYLLMRNEKVRKKDLDDFFGKYPQFKPKNYDEILKKNRNIIISEK